jgi:dipeptidyl aminopeptidase/acylaminoacyl peptidase
MRAHVLLAGALALGALPIAQSPVPDGTLLERAAYRFPPYSHADGIQPYATAQEYADATSDDRFTFERLVYSSDGLRVISYAYGPRDGRAGRRPTVVFNRGSYVQPDIGHQLVPLFHRLAERGFAVVAPMLRGSAGGAGTDEMGGADLRDLLSARALAASLPFVDADNLFLYGESRGGMMTLLAIKAGFPARAAATFGAFSDLGLLIDSAPRRYDALVRQIWPDFPTRRREILASRSAIQWPEAIVVPVLLMHGGADRDVDPAQALALAGALQRMGKPYELAIYAGDNHVLSAHRVERDAHAVAWFSAHLRR